MASISATILSCRTSTNPNPNPAFTTPLLSCRTFTLLPSLRSPFFCFQCVHFSSHSITPSYPETLQPPISLFLLTECGFSSTQISKIMQTTKSLLKTRSPNTAREAVQFLKQWGFTQPELHNTILRYPLVLTLKVETQLKPKFQYFQTLGFTDQELRNLISARPRLLGRSLESSIIPTISLLENMLGAKRDLTKALKGSPALLGQSSEKLKLKSELFNQWGIQGESLSLLISINTRILWGFSVETLRARMEYARNTMGIVQGSKKFIYGTSVFLTNRPQTVETKMKHLQSLGLLEDEEVRELFIKHPWLLGYSINKIQENMDFLTQTAGLTPRVVLSYPYILRCSIKKKLMPRYEIFKALLSSEQQSVPDLITIFRLTERSLLKKIVECNTQASKLKEIAE